MDILKYIYQIPLFQLVDLSILMNLNIPSRAFAKKIKKNAIIYLKGEKCSSLDAIVTGIVSVQTFKLSGDIMTIANFTRGDTIGSNLLFYSNHTFPMTVIAKTDVLIISFTKDAILDLCSICPLFLERFLAEISHKAIVLMKKIDTIALKSIRERIMEFLRVEQKRQNSHTIVLPFSKKEWAEVLAIQRPSLSRELAKMRKEGIIQFKGRIIAICECDDR